MGVISVHQVWVLIFQVCWSKDALIQVCFCMLVSVLRELLHRSKMNVDSWKQIASDFAVPKPFLGVVMEVLGY